MREHPAMVLALFLSFGMLVACLAAMAVTEHPDIAALDGAFCAPVPPTADSSTTEPNELSGGLEDVSEPAGASTSTPDSPGGPALDGDARLPRSPTYLDAVLLFRDPPYEGEWLPLPTESEYLVDPSRMVVFPNGTQQEIHGRLFEEIINTSEHSYLNATSYPNLTFKIFFDGELVPRGTVIIGNCTTPIEPFDADGNGSFQFILDIAKPAGVYILKIIFEGYPPGSNELIRPLDYRSVIGVSHPSMVELEVTPASQVVGQEMRVWGLLYDDTATPITGVPMKVLMDGTLIGATSDGVYIDDVQVLGTDFYDDFEANDLRGWTILQGPGQDVPAQWEHGSPAPGHGPPYARGGARLVGTILDGDYQRGAHSLLLSPRLDLTADRDYALRFWAWWSVSWNGDLAYVMISEDGGTTWDEAGATRFMGTELQSGWWRSIEVNLTKHKGSSDVRFALVFRSVDKSLDVGPDGSFQLDYVLPKETGAGRHRVTAEFPGSKLFRVGLRWMDISVKRISSIVLEQDASLKVGHRNGPITVVAWLKDNEGEVPGARISGIPYYYYVTCYIGPDRIISPPEGRSGVMDPLTGKVIISYIVAGDQNLGPMNLTLRFGGSDFYTSANAQDAYFIKADVYVRFPEGQSTRVIRGDSVLMRCSLNIKPDQSLVDLEFGDVVRGEFVSIYWGPELIGNRRNGLWDPNWSYMYEFMVPSIHPLGNVVVTYIYKGNAVLEPTTLFVNWTVASRARISLSNATVYKGSWAWINGTIEDDSGEPVANVPIYIIWKRAPEIGRATSRPDGGFALQYYIEYEDRVGNVSLIARFKGNEVYEACDANATYKVTVDTVLQRRDRVMTTMLGNFITIACKLYEDWGGTKGIEVQREEVEVYIDDVFVTRKLTAFDGTITFTVPIDPEMFHFGEVDLLLLFNGTEFHGPSYNKTSILIRINYLIDITGLYVNGAPFDPSVDVLRWNDHLECRVLMRTDGFKPIPDVHVMLNYSEDRLMWTRTTAATAVTDDEGRCSLNWTPRMTEGMVIYLDVECRELRPDSFLKANDVILPFSGWHKITYIVPPPPTAQPIIRALGDRELVIGESLELRVRPRASEDWDGGNLTFALVSPPAGVSISPDGIITWTPTLEQTGTHELTVWLYDGNRSMTSTLVVFVREDGPTWDMGGVVSIIALMAVLFTLVLGRALRHRSKAGQG